MARSSHEHWSLGMAVSLPAVTQRLVVRLLEMHIAALLAIAAFASGGGTGIAAQDSQFGTMLFNSHRQAIYIFQSDGRKSHCYGTCATYWPPVYTASRPRA